MVQTLLATKLYIPPVRSERVPRPRLIERLDTGLRGKLTLVSAPAGYGKTTLVSDWIARSQVPAAWLSLDASDNDPVRFLTYLIAALQRIDERIGADIRAALGESQAPPGETLLTRLVSEIGLGLRFGHYIHPVGQLSIANDSKQMQHNRVQYLPNSLGG